VLGCNDVSPILDCKYLFPCRTKNKHTWYSMANLREGMNTSNSRNSPVSGLIRPASFLALIIMSVASFKLKI